MSISSVRARLRSAWRGVVADARLQDELAGASPRRVRLGALAHPSLRAGWLFRLAAGGGRLGRCARNALLSLHACDVSPGARFEGALHLPHPHGITIGIGVVVGDRVAVYQGVTLGADRAGRYPVIADRVRLFPQSVIAGGIRVGAGATVGALSFVSRTVAPGTTVHRHGADRRESAHPEARVPEGAS
ncbi:serine O-acetyltransferase [Microbacterium resistens]|uniref:serine O-acetyltransferase n=1 Tax=Microbacterium resistens TaxID=156977 RepID=UPI00366F961B